MGLGLYDPRAIGAAGSILISLGGLASGALPVSYRGFPAGVAIVYFGLIALIVAWWRIPRTDPRHLTHTIALWAAPLAFTPPLFSRDVYSYLAQGAMVVAGLDVYRAGPARLGGPLAAEVAPIWLDSPAPYGPVFLWTAVIVAELAQTDVIAGVVGMRLVALFGFALLAWGLPDLARRCGVDPAKALWLGVLNPLALLHLVAGAHNDALMLGLLVAGLALTMRHLLVAATVLITLAALVKVPAALGLLVVAHQWMRAHTGTLRRWGSALACFGFLAATTIVVTYMVGTGYGWLSALDTPVSATNWSLSSAVGRLAGDAGLSRWIGLAIAIAVGAAVWLHRPALSPVHALGLSLGALAVLGPALRPWYLLWGLIPLAASAPDGKIRHISAVICSVLAIVLLPDGYPPTVEHVLLAALGGGLALWAARSRRLV